MSHQCSRMLNHYVGLNWYCLTMPIHLLGWMVEQHQLMVFELVYFQHWHWIKSMQQQRPMHWFKMLQVSTYLLKLETLTHLMKSSSLWSATLLQHGLLVHHFQKPVHELILVLFILHFSCTDYCQYLHFKWQLCYLACRKNQYLQYDWS
jgi:hypothetical protein